MALAVVFDDGTILADSPRMAGPIDQLQVQVAALQAIVTQQQAQIATLQQQVAALQNNGAQALAPYVTVVPGALSGLKGAHVIFFGANVHVTSDSGATDDDGTLTGLGDLVVGYNECQNCLSQTGTHNLVVGPGHSYTSFGGFVAGNSKSIGNAYASVSGGVQNHANSFASSILGGSQQTTTELYQTIPPLP